MTIQMLMAMIPGAEGFKTQGLELLKSAHELTAAVDAIKAGMNESPVIFETAIDNAISANDAFKANLAKLPPMPGE